MPDDCFSHNEYTFVWDTEKAALNFKKHGITFQTAARVFDDELRLELPDLSPYRYKDGANHV